MMDRDVGLGVVMASVLAAAAVGLVPRFGRACSAPMDVRHRIAWAADGALLALADPEGRIVRIAPAAATGEVLGGAARFAHRHSDFTRDGRGLVVIDEQGSETGDCSPVSITVAQVGLADGARTASGRAFDVAGVWAVRSSPSGRWAAVGASTDEARIVRIFELARARAVRRLPATEMLWLDDERLAVMRETGNIHVVRMGDRRGLLQVGPVPPAGVERHLLPGDEGPNGFTFVEKVADGWSIVRVRLDGPRPTLSTHAWRRSQPPVSISRDGLRLSVVREDGRAVFVHETATDRIVGALETTHSVTQAVLSPDGARLGLASHELPTADEDESAFGDASAFQPTAVQVIDLSRKAVAATWGAQARITFPTFIVSGPLPPRSGRP